MQVAQELTIQDDLLLRGCRLVIPKGLRKEILKCLHNGHMGIGKCRERAKQSVWWPGSSTEFIEYVEKCAICCKEMNNPTESLIPTEFPKLPWQMVAIDLLMFKGKSYIVVIDCFSRYIELGVLQNQGR